MWFSSVQVVGHEVPYSPNITICCYSWLPFRTNSDGPIPENTAFLRHETRKSYSTQKLHSCWLNFIAPKRFVYTLRDRNHQQSQQTVNTVNNNNNQLGKISLLVPQCHKCYRSNKPLSNYICSLLFKMEHSTVYRTPNPWLAKIIGANITLFSC